MTGTEAGAAWIVKLEEISNWNLVWDAKKNMAVKHGHDKRYCFLVTRGFLRCG
jgi:hypothetical protein